MVGGSSIWRASGALLGVGLCAAAMAAPVASVDVGCGGALSLVRAIFAAAPLACDLNGDGRVSAADLTSVQLGSARPTPTASPTATIVSATPTASATATAVPATPTASATPPPSPTLTRVPTVAIRFVDVTAAAAVDTAAFAAFSGGVAAGDYDRDGDVDLYAVVMDRGGHNPLYRNNGDGTFTDVAVAAGVALTGLLGATPSFGDYDGDGWLDLFVEGVVNAGTRLYRNRGDGTFEDVSATARICTAYEKGEPTCDGCDSPGGAAWGDYDRDGDLDLFLTHLETEVPEGGVQNLWRNDGGGSVTDGTAAAGVAGQVFDRGKGPSSYMYAPIFADIDNDGWPDLLVASDWGSTQYFINDGDGTFTERTSAAITDENGMGAAVGDYDNDGNLDWFVTSIWDPRSAETEGILTGNRLYRGRGDGSVEEVSEQAGVRVGYWGWAACFADVNNDGWLDIFHVNGADEEGFRDDPSVLFLANGDGTFSEQAASLGIDDRGWGQGLVCFDYDRDGDIDLFIQNRRQPPRLYRNDGGNQAHWLAIRLVGAAPNREAIGARITITVGGQPRIHEIRAGSNFMSQDPAEAHFGLGAATVVERLDVIWPDGSATVLTDVAADQLVVATQPEDA